MSERPITLRAYAAADETATIELWLRSWQVAYPAIDFAARRSWLIERWRSEIVPSAAVMLAERGAEILGLVTVDTATGYVDQIATAPETWGHGVASALIDEAKRLAPRGVDLHVNQDNARAIRFYEKHGFANVGTGINPHSGAPVFKMRWVP